MSQRKGAKIRDKAEKKAAKIATKGCGVVCVLLQVPLRRLNVTLCVTFNQNTAQEFMILIEIILHI